MNPKELLSVFLVLLCVISLSGCNSLTDRSETEQVSAFENSSVPGPENTSQNKQVSEGRKEKNQIDSEERGNRTENRINVKGELDIDPDRVYSQLNSLFGKRVRVPQKIVTYNNITSPPSPPRIDVGFLRLMIDETPSAVTGTSGTYSNGVVKIITSGRTSRDIEATLAHEYAHHFQEELGLKPRESNSMWYESSFIRTALSEGGAVYVTQKYIDRYMDWEKLKQDKIDYVESNYAGEYNFSSTRIDSQIGFIAASYNQLNAAEKYFAAPYYFGSQYISKRADSVNDYLKIYENPPTTTEQLIHGYGPEEEEPKSLEINTSGLPYDVSSDRARMGEIGLRLTLLSELDKERAVKASKGWGNDRLIPVRGDRGLNYIWVIKMDSKKDTSELFEATRKYFERRASKNGGVWFDSDDSVHFGIDRLSDRVVVVAIGSQKFAELVAGVNGTDSGIKVSG